jgi:hypothetical protein
VGEEDGSADVVSWCLGFYGKSNQYRRTPDELLVLAAATRTSEKLALTATTSHI